MISFNRVYFSPISLSTSSTSDRMRSAAPSGNGSDGWVSWISIIFSTSHLLSGRLKSVWLYCWSRHRRYADAILYVAGQGNRWWLRLTIFPIIAFLSGGWHFLGVAITDYRWNGIWMRILSSFKCAKGTSPVDKKKSLPAAGGRPV